MTYFECPKCGDSKKIEESCEGYCQDCQKENQYFVDEHNAQLDYWQKLTDKERRNVIFLAVTRL